MDSKCLIELSLTDLEKLKNSFSTGALYQCVNATTLSQTVPSISKACISLLMDYSQQGWSPTQLHTLVESIINTKEHDKESLSDLVLSGPKHPQIPTRDTFSVYLDLIKSAKKSALLASYAVYNGKELFKHLAEKLVEIENFQVQLFLDIPRKYGDKTLSAQILQNYKADFLSKQWPGKKDPELYYFNNSLNSEWAQRASMHSKVIIIDEKRVFISSANLTKAAQSKNIETGVLLHDVDYAKRLTNYFNGQINQGVFTALI